MPGKAALWASTIPFARVPGGAREQSKMIDLT
jgi:hypothetical protein